MKSSTGSFSSPRFHPLTFVSLPKNEENNFSSYPSPPLPSFHSLLFVAPQNMNWTKNANMEKRRKGPSFFSYSYPRYVCRRSKSKGISSPFFSSPFNRWENSDNSCFMLSCPLSSAVVHITFPFDRRRFIAESFKNYLMSDVHGTIYHMILNITNYT